MSGTILIVEDDIDTREMLGRFLELEGYRVETAENGKRALERLGSGVEACVILLDLMMPVMDGWHFRVTQVQDSALANIPVVVLSGAGNIEQEAAALGVAGYVAKPFDVSSLLGVVQHTCASA